MKRIIAIILFFLALGLSAAPDVLAQKHNGGAAQKSPKKKTAKVAPAPQIKTAPKGSPSGFAIALRFRDVQGSEIGGSVKFGVNVAATNCVDAALGESYLPPTPPRGLPDVRFLNPSGSNDSCYDLGINGDIRPYRSAAQVDTFLLHVQFSPESYPVTMAWEPLGKLYAGSVSLEDVYGGKIFHADMKKDTTAKIDKKIESVLIIASKPVVGKK